MRLRPIALSLAALATAALATAALATAALAAPKAQQAYLCKMSYISKDKFIQPELAFWIYPDGSVAVLDGMIAHYNDKKPVGAEKVRDGDKRLQFSWTVKKIEGQLTEGNKRKFAFPEVRYTAQFIKASSAINVSARITGADNKPQARGTCAPIKR